MGGFAVKILLDTCSIIWAVSAPDSLSEKARTALCDPENQVLYSPISCMEVAWAVRRGRIVLDRHWKLWFRHHVTLNDWQEAPIDLSVIEEAYSLPEPFHSDPADRILVATCRLDRLTLITADRKILDYPHVSSLW
jgi:PIN domain nuclease of toxin-antitoxin system